MFKSLEGSGPPIYAHKANVSFDRSVVGSKVMCKFGAELGELGG